MDILTKVTEDMIQNGTYEITSNVKAIGEDCFSQLLKLEYIEIPSNVQYVDIGAFAHCTNLKNVVFKNANCELGYTPFNNGYTFFQCSSLEMVFLPKQLINIPNSTFRDCTSLREIIIPDTIEELREEPFFECFNLKKIHWRGKLYSYDDLFVYGKMR